MAKISVVVHRDENLFPRRIEIKKGRKKLKVKQTPSPLGDSYSIDFEGRRDVLPSFPEILSIVNAKRLDRIGTIELINLIEKIEQIELIDKITKIGTIDKLYVGTADRGFTFGEIKEFLFEEEVIAGTTADKDTFTPDVNGYYEVLSLQVYCSNAPSEAPYIAKNVVDFPAPDTKALIKIPLTLGISANTYELDLTEKRLIASRTANIIETLTVYEPANATSNTTFYWKGVFVKYVLPT